MGQEITSAADWTDTITLQPSGLECLEFCLEPEESMIVAIIADHTIDAALVDWDSYTEWKRTGTDGMPAGTRFANDAHIASWKSWATKPPYLEVLVLRNPSDRQAAVAVEARIAARAERKPPGTAAPAGDEPTDTIVECGR
jgi:hypothetical protein